MIELAYLVLISLILSIIISFTCGEDWFMGHIHRWIDHHRQQEIKEKWRRGMI
jgi:hypothetical protein